MPLRRWGECKLGQKEGERRETALTGLQEMLQGTWVQEMTLIWVLSSVMLVHRQSWHLLEYTGDPGFGNRQE